MDSDFKLQMNKNKRNVSLVLKCVSGKNVMNYKNNEIKFKIGL